MLILQFLWTLLVALLDLLDLNRYKMNAKTSKINFKCIFIYCNLQDISETLLSSQFTAEYTICHGFPFKPLCMAYDPIQKLMAIGNKTGSVRIFGKPGVSVEFKHETECQVIKKLWFVCGLRNAGHLWYIIFTANNHKITFWGEVLSKSICLKCNDDNFFLAPYRLVRC